MISVTWISAVCALVDSPTMRIKRFLRTAVPVLLGMSLAVTRADGAHLHVCLDGQEDPVALHSPDNGVHHAEDGGSPHEDRELDLSDDSLRKFTPKGLEVAALLPGAIILETIGATGEPPPTFHVVPATANRRFLLPPLRGPPA
jgi:hypothetical protein